jgi:hypothetical protein
MRVFTLAILPLLACSNDQPPPVGDSDAGTTRYYQDDSGPLPEPEDSGNDAGATVYTLDFEGTCASGTNVVWAYFDFQTHTPENSSLEFVASSAATEAELSSAPTVSLGTVTGADITSWEGVEVDSQLQTIGQMSRLYLRVVVIETPATDGTPPVLVHYRQAFDCLYD